MITTTIANAYPLPLGPRDGVTVSGPRISIAIDVDLRVLATTGEDVGTVIAAVATTLCDIVNATAPTLPLAIVVLTDFVLAVPGVLAVRSLKLNGVASDLAASGNAYALLPNAIDVTDVRVVGNVNPGPGLPALLAAAKENR